MEDHLIIPIVSLRNIERIRRLFTYNEEEDNLHLNYVEPLVEQHGRYIWRVEYKVDRNSKYHDNTELARLLQRIKHRIGQFECVNVYFNLLNRIYMYIPPHASNNRICSAGKVEKSPKRKERDSARMKTFKAELASNIAEAEKLGFDLEKIKDFSPQEKLNRLRKYIKNKNSESSTKEQKQRPIAFVSGGVQVPPPSFSGSETAKKDEGAIHEIPSQRIMAMSCNSNDKRFAKGRLLTPDLYPIIRRYVSHLFDCGYGFINSCGESRLSTESLLMREGLCHGLEMVKLYYEAMKDRGFKDEEIKEDLEGLKAYEQTSRIIRLQTAREKTRSWYGLKGGALCHIDPVDYEYHQISRGHIKVNGSRGVSVSIYDASGEVKMFN